MIELDEENAKKWRNDILDSLEGGNYEMDIFNLYKEDEYNKRLLEHIALKSETYNYLNSQGLVNAGICPITGEHIDESYNYNIYGRHIYLSKNGLQICEKLNKNDFNNSNSKVDKDEFDRLMSNSRGKSIIKATFIVLFIGVISIYLSWVLITPSGFFAFIFFLVIAFIFYTILGNLFNYIWDIFN